ncbi:DUF928 domain-containing protein [Leptolyngbyaceae cyanobacterium UHCC 1019]
MKALIYFLMSVSGAIALSVPSSHASHPTWQQPTLLSRYSPPRPPSKGAPGTNRGAASRGCLMLAKITKDAVLDNLGALVPAYQEKATTHVWARTTAERPKIWFYNPYKPESIESIEFVLQDDQETDIYRGAVSLPQTAGVIGVQVPKTASLQPGKLYHWYLNVKGKSACASRTSSRNTSTLADAQTNPPIADSMAAMVYVDGWIERVLVNPDLSDRLKQATPQQQSALYGEHGFWYDAVTILAETQLAKLNDAALKTDWQTLLQDGGLEMLSAQPLVNCCSPR